MSGARSPLNTERAATINSKLDDLARTVQSSIAASRKVNADGVLSIQTLVLNVERIIARNMVDLRTELREIKNTLPSKQRTFHHMTMNGSDITHERASDLNLRDDPRKTIAAFFQHGDDRGPCGALQKHGLVPDSSRPDSRWFAVFRPTSSDAISKMVFGDGTGKGLNVKGKSAKKGELAGFVPFLQISDNIHRQQLLTAREDSRFQLFFTSADSRNSVKTEMEKVLQEMTSAYEEAKILLEEIRSGTYTPTVEEKEEAHQKHLMRIDTPHIEELFEFEPVTFGLDLPERLFREVYVNRKDLSQSDGWEIGRKSVPAFANMNIQAVRNSMQQYRQSNGTKDRVVLYQVDNVDPLNPHSLVMAYAEPDAVKPVVSDFDALIIGSKGMCYDPLEKQQADLMRWSLDHTQGILSRPCTHPWSARWINILKSEADKGFHPNPPELGYGDPTTYKLFEDLVFATKSSGAVRHGAECFNFYFPQELDPEYLVVWDGFSADKPWSYLSEPDLRSWLVERAAEGYSFPLNPVWPVRDAGWYEVLQALRNSMSASQALEAWFPQESGILAKIDAIHEKYPDGFTTVRKISRSGSNGSLDLAQHTEIKTSTAEIEAHELSALEAADWGLHEVQRYAAFKRAKRKLKAYLLLQCLYKKNQA